jgi:curved DNA-binding protein CbpA
MATERRNLYRILNVQPEAPQEVIKASFRALMGSMRAHPDLGGDHEMAARLNAAYQVLGDPQRRSAYDQSLRRPVRGVAMSQPLADPWAWLADRRCPFCAHEFNGRPSADMRCARCQSPLGPAPSAAHGSAELLGRRRNERFRRELDAVVRVAGMREERAARLRDLSLSGLSLVTVQRIPKGAAFRVTAPNFETVAVVVASRPAGAAFTTHAQMLTLQMVRSGRGVFVAETA